MWSAVAVTPLVTEKTLKSVFLSTFRPVVLSATPPSTSTTSRPSLYTANWRPTSPSAIASSTARLKTSCGSTLCLPFSCARRPASRSRGMTLAMVMPPAAFQRNPRRERAGPRDDERLERRSVLAMARSIGYRPGSGQVPVITCLGRMRARPPFVPFLPPCSAAVVIMSAGSAFTSAVATKAQDVTFAKDAAPILFDRYGSCHHPGGVGPFSLLTYGSARQHAARIGVVTKKRSMPPWKSEPHGAEFVGQQRLTDAEIDPHQRWIA